MNEIQKRIDEFYKQYGKNKPKEVNNRCPRHKKSAHIQPVEPVKDGAQYKKE